MKQNNSLLVNGILLVIILGAVGIFFAVQPSGPNTETMTTSDTKGQQLVEWDLEVDGESQGSIEIELAETSERRSQGLSGRENLSENQGMLFAFNESGQHQMWMQGMKFPLDMAWITENGEVVHMMTDIPVSVGGGLPVYQNDEPAKYVLEMNAGSFDSLGIEEGATLNIEAVIDEFDSI